MGTGPALIPCSRKAPDSHSSPFATHSAGLCAATEYGLRRKAQGNLLYPRLNHVQSSHDIRSRKTGRLLLSCGREGLPILGGSPFLEEADGRNYFSRVCFSNLATHRLRRS